MGDPRGFMKVKKEKLPERPVDVRLRDWHETTMLMPDAALRSQAARCMDCGIPFCHSGCPLGNLIPEWNDQVFRGRWDDALRALYETNNFPEFTGRVCPAPCEASCVLNIDNIPVSIKAVERTMAEYAYGQGLVPHPAPVRTGKRVAVIGSGPAGLAAAQQLARAGHDVTLYERDDRLGGLLRYGIPDFKLEKDVIDKRLEQMRQEGVVFRTGVHAGVDITGDDLKAQYDAIVLAGGARHPRDLVVPGREFPGVYFAMQFLVQQNRRLAGGIIPEAESITAKGKHVIVIGGGDTGSDCVGTANRQGAKSIVQLELLSKPPEMRFNTNPWPEWPLIMRTSSSHEEGCERDWGVMTTRFVVEGGRVTRLDANRVKLEQGQFKPLPGSDFSLPCDLALLAMGFLGAEKPGLLEQLGVDVSQRQAVTTNGVGATNVPGVFAAGDMSRGQSLVVWAIADGRRVASGVDAYLRARDRDAAGDDRAA